VSVTADGYLDWAIQLPSSNGLVNGGTSQVRGLFMHSAEGYASTLLDPNSEWGYNGNHSWHLSNLMDGRVVQHYPFYAQCHHATAANNNYVGVENEGVHTKERSLNEVQVANAARFIKDISEWKGWVPTRTGTVAQTLWEHREVVWLGGTATACPSGRIPWHQILAQLSPTTEEDTGMKAHYAWASWFDGREIGAGGQIYVAQVRSDFSLPTEAKACLLQPIMAAGSTEWYHGGSDIPGVPVGNAFLVLLDEKGTANFRVKENAKFRRLQCVGYYQ
jgi:hypothetical protein